MKIINTKDLRDMEVINICDGSKLGYPSDFEFDADNCKITALIVPGKEGFFGMFCKDEYSIPWCFVDCIGEDTILVKIPSDDMHSCCKGKKKK